MSIILSSLTMQANMQENLSNTNVLHDAARRVRSMAILYDKLYRSDNINCVSGNKYLLSLIHEIINIFPQKEFVKIEIQSDNFILDAGILSPLGLIINELITNSMKYAFKGQKDGVLKIIISKKENLVRIIYEDNGNGISESVSFENSTGFGLQLVGMIVKQINGSIIIESKNRSKIIIEFTI